MVLDIRRSLSDDTPGTKRLFTDRCVPADERGGIGVRLETMLRGVERRLKNRLFSA
jgi:hypothetical protein